MSAAHLRPWRDVPPAVGPPIIEPAPDDLRAFERLPLGVQIAVARGDVALADALSGADAEAADD